jgi:hypothetical protein
MSQSGDLSQVARPSDGADDAVGIPVMIVSVLHLFGDESAYKSIVTYALVCVDEGEQAAAERALAKVIGMFKGPPGERLHCRQLFAGDARRKTEWAHLSRHQPFELMFFVANRLRRAGVSFRVGVVNAASIPDQAPFVAHGTATPTGTKQLAALALTAVLRGVLKWRRASRICAFGPTPKLLRSRGEGARCRLVGFRSPLAVALP